MRGARGGLDDETVAEEMQEADALYADDDGERSLDGDNDGQAEHTKRQTRDDDEHEETALNAYVVDTKRQRTTVKDMMSKVRERASNSK